MGGAANNFYRQKGVERLHRRSIITGLKLASRISKFFHVRSKTFDGPRRS